MEITSLMLQSLVLPAAVIAILFALWLAGDVLRRDKGTPAMQDVAGMIFEGAVAFMRRQYITISVLSVAMAVLIGALIANFETAAVADTEIYGADLGIRTGIAFIFGAACSMASGVIGMYQPVIQPPGSPGYSRDYADCSRSSSLASDQIFIPVSLPTGKPSELVFSARASNRVRSF